MQCPFLISQTKGVNMQCRKLGDIDVPVIGMGSAASSGFDVESSEEIHNCKEIVDNCIANGCTFLDTSPMYRRAEGVMGIAISGRRHKFKLATKVWCAGLETGKAQISRSYALLRTDYIDVLQIHNLVDWKTHLPYLEHLKEQGKIGLIGLSHYQPQFYPEMAEVMKTGRIDTIQIPYSLLERDVEQFILPLAAEMNIGVIVMRPLVKGTVVTGLKSEPNLSPLKEYGIETWGQAAMAWILADSRVTVLIPATTRPKRIVENSIVGSINIPGEIRKYIADEAARCL